MDSELLDNIRRVAHEIEEGEHPEHIILFNQKTGVNGNLTGFKLCVVVDAGDKADVEKRIYLGIESDIPFDVVLYTPSEWNNLVHTPHSFASVINETGVAIL
ncbi:MAG: hypothetical protein ACERKO_03235 [Acetanaerobacterium sp.]